MKTYKGMLSVVCCWCLCLSLCSFSFAANSAAEKPVEENSIVHPLTQKEILNKEIALQKQKEKEIEEAKAASASEHVCEETKANRVSINDAWKDLTPEQIAVKEAYYAKEEAEKSVNSSSITAVPEAPVLQRKLNADKIKVDTPVVNEPKAPRANDKTAYYNQLHEDHAASFNGPTLPDFIRPSEDGSRTGTVDATICSDYWSSETYWILLDTTNWWAWGADGWTQHTAGSYGCEDWSATVPAGDYLFIWVCC